MSKPETQWLPLESNPDVMNKFMTSMGVPNKFQCTDVFGLDPELLAMLPQPTIAMFLLFPCGEGDAKRTAKSIAEHGDGNASGCADLYFMKQKIKNACGTFALIHALANNMDKLDCSPDSALQKFYDKTKSMGPDERSDALESEVALSVAHAEIAQEGQTEAPRLDDKVDHHFISFAEVDGTLYEFDGRKPCPIPHGSSTTDSFLSDVAKVCKSFMDDQPGELGFTMMALAANN